MRKKTDAINFFENEANNKLLKLDKEREKIKLKLIITISILSITVLAFFIGSSFDFEILLGGSFLAFSIYVLIFSWITKKFKKNYKNLIVEPLLKKVYPEISFNPNEKIPQYHFNKSDLFRTKYDRYLGEDLIEGEIEDIEFQCSELDVSKIEGSGKNRRRVTIFKGLYTIGSFNKHFKGHTVVLPDIASNIFGSLIGQWLQSKNILRNNLVKMDNIKFEKEFVVYSTDEIEARYILTPAMMNRILIYKKILRNKKIAISFVEQNIHIAIHTTKNHFEPTYFTSLYNKKNMIDYLQSIDMIVSFINDLKLNEKLWTRY